MPDRAYFFRSLKEERGCLGLSNPISRLNHKNLQLPSSNLQVLGNPGGRHEKLSMLAPIQSPFSGLPRDAGLPVFAFLRSQVAFSHLHDFRGHGDDLQ